MPDAFSKDQSSPRSTVLIASIGPETISDGQVNDGDLSYSVMNPVFVVPLRMEDDVFGEGRASVMRKVVFYNSTAGVGPA